MYKVFGIFSIIFNKVHTKYLLVSSLLRCTFSTNNSSPNKSTLYYLLAKHSASCQDQKTNLDIIFVLYKRPNIFNNEHSLILPTTEGGWVPYT